MQQYILAHDLGTSGNKATLYDTSGALIRSEVVSYPTRFFSENWAEQNPDDWWEAVCLSTKRLLESVDDGSVAVVSFSGHMMGCLAVDSKGRPIRPHILYCDQRALRQAQQIRDAMAPWEFYTTTGHRPSASYTLERVMWLKDNEPETYRTAYKFLNAKDYIVLRLTGAFATDYSDAGGTEVFDINRMCWSERIADVAGIDLEKFPDAHNSSHIVGEVTANAAKETGIPAGVPVCCGAGDGCAAGVGAGSLSEGTTYTCVGSSGWVGATSEKPIYDPAMRVPTFPHAVPGLYHSCGAMQTAGASLSWAGREIWGDAKDYKHMDEAMAESGPGANGVIFLPYLMGERSPWWDDSARGCFLGLHPDSTRGDMMRAVEEGVAFNLGTILDVYRDYIDIRDMVFVGGAASSDLWRDILANVYNVPVSRPRNTEECASLGAAVIGAVGVGLLDSFESAAPFFEAVSTKYPDQNEADFYAERIKVFQKSYLALKSLFPEL